MNENYIGLKISEPRLFSWGSGSFGQHGHLIDENIQPIDGFLKNPSVNVQTIFCGACYTFVLKDDGTALGWGSNQNGQIGCSHQRQCLTPTRAHVENVVQLSAGDRHTLFLLRDGSVRGCGSNFYAQLSVDALEELQRQDKSIPITLALPERVKQVACGQYHSLLLYETGEIATVGRNIYGQLGVSIPECVKTDVLETPSTIEGAFKSHIVRVNAGQNHSIAIDDAGRCYVWGYCRACGSRGDHVIRPKQLTFLADTDGVEEPPAITGAAGGSSHSLFLAGGRHDSGVFALGCNLDGQCGLGDAINFVARPMPLDISWTSGASVASIDCAENYSCAVTTTGELWIWGRNSGVLTAATAATNAAADAEAPRVFSPQRVPVPFSVLSIACGNWHAAAIVNYKEPMDVSHLPGGRSSRRTTGEQSENLTMDDRGEKAAAWVDIVSSREEKPPACASSAATVAEGAVVPQQPSMPADPLALEDLDVDDSNVKKRTPAPQLPPTSLGERPPRPPPPPPGSANAAGMRRAKSLSTRVPGGEGRQQMRLRRVQPSSPVQMDSELVHVYRLDPGGVGRPGTATYHSQRHGGPPQLEKRHSSQPASSQQLPPELRSLQLVEAAVDAARPSLPAHGARRGSAGAPAAQLVAQSSLSTWSVPPPSGQAGSCSALSAPMGAIRRRPVSASGGAAGAPPSLPVRQNLASLRRMSSAGRLAAGNRELDAVKLN